MKITMDGKYQTRDGRKVRILVIDAGPPLPIIGLYPNFPGTIEGDNICRWYSNGNFYHENFHMPSNLDLLEAPEEMYVEVVRSLRGPYASEITKVPTCHHWSSGLENLGIYKLVKAED